MAKNSHKEVITSTYTSRNAAYNNAKDTGTVTERTSNSGKTTYYDVTKEATISDFGSSKTVKSH